jgi:hypothetical protein
VETELWAGMAKEAMEKMKKSIAEKVPTGRMGQRKQSVSNLNVKHR